MPLESPAHRCVLTINGGSSSLKFAIFRATRPLTRVLSGKFERIGLPDGSLSVEPAACGTQEQLKLELPNHAACIPVLAELLRANEADAPIQAIGHRVVHGGSDFSEPERVTPRLLEQLRPLSPFAPEHMPTQIALLEELGRQYPDLPQVACFDTAFHRDMPRVARLLPIPRRYDAAGVRRYGFHGLSYTYLMQELKRIGGPAAANGRVILAHLGNGASMAAVRGGRSIDTTMAFTPAAGLVMSTRSGDLDPGVVAYLARTEGMTVEQFYHMVNAESGLRGVSETSSDMRDLLEHETTDVRAAEAAALFCYQAKKWIGALAAALGGLDTLVFAGGIGERAAVIRARICDGLEFLGIRLDAARNEACLPVITKDDSPATVRVIPTDEELLIAQTVITLLENHPNRDRKGADVSSPSPPPGVRP
ncbi:MAG TPA: acetate/propionate family kinase [Phycisphaerae bacterium]|nr:acetate/propionate family kinase [Phycisphaerae bacterium]